MWLPLGRLWGEGLERAWVQGEADPPPKGWGSGIYQPILGLSVR